MSSSKIYCNFYVYHHHHHLFKMLLCHLLTPFRSLTSRSPYIDLLLFLVLVGYFSIACNLLRGIRFIRSNRFILYCHLGRFHIVVHRYTAIFIYICRLNTTFFNDIIGDRFRSYKTILRPCTLLKT